jgi:hypothetical protein
LTRMTMPCCTAMVGTDCFGDAPRGAAIGVEEQFGGASSELGVTRLRTTLIAAGAPERPRSAAWGTGLDPWAGGAYLVDRTRSLRGSRCLELQ